MALCKAGGGVTELRGSISGNTFSRNRGGMIVRARTVPTNTRSSSQSKSRTLFAFLTAAWNKELTPFQRTAWDTYARAVASKNKIGETIHLTGQLQFIRTNQARMTAGLSLVTDGPSVLSLPEKDPTLIITASASTQEITLTFDSLLPWSNENGAYLLVHQGRPQPRTQNYFTGPWRYATKFIGSATSPPSPPYDFTSIFPLNSCQKVWFSLQIIRADGRCSEPFTFSCLTESQPLTCLANYPISINPCNNKDLWSPTLATLSNDPTFHRCSDPIGLSVKMTMASPATTTGWMDYAYNTPQNLLDPRGKPPLVLFRFFIPPGEGDSSYTKIYSIDVRIGNLNLSSFFYSYIAASFNLKTGWWSMLCTPSSFASSGTPLWSNIQKIRIRITTTIVNMTPSVVLDEIRFIPGQKKASIIFSMDDAKESAIDVATYLTSKNLVATFYVAPTNIGKPGYLTVDQLHTISDQGHLIANHTYHHLDWLTHTDAEMLADIEECKNWMIANGFTAGSRIFALPEGSSRWPSTGEALLIGTTLDSVRLTYWGSSTLTPYITPYRRDLLYATSTDSVTVATLSLNAAIPEGFVTSPYFHKSTGPTYTWEQLQAFIDLIAEKRDAGDLLIKTPLDRELLPT